MNSLPEPVQNYLKKYGINKWELVGKIDSEIKNIIVVPAIGELENIKTLLNSINQIDRKYFHKTLILFVLNNLSSSSAEVKNDNEKTRDLLQKIITHKTSDKFSNSISDLELKIAFIDAFTRGNELPEKEGGVGLARKIGMDLALKCFNYSLPGKKIIICLDADCEVDRNYLTKIVETSDQKKINAAVVKYEHKIPEDSESAAAIICYEIFLRYYVLGLKYTNSPYAFHTVGSTMVCDYESYIKIGGMNKKKAAEDFYFLEKLSKIVNIDYIESTKVYPSSRKSWRVPFGTGQRVNRFFAKTHREYFLYNPASFDILKKWDKVFYNEEKKKGADYLNEAKKINTELYKFLQQQKFIESWDKILKNSNNPKQILNQKKFWFDGFRTLKLIHHLRDYALPPINMFTALDNLFRMLNHKFDLKRGRSDVPDLKIQLKYLKKLRELT